MKSKLILTLMIALTATILMTGCGNDVIIDYDPPPQPPQDVFTITGDNSVFIHWTAPYEADITHFGVYRSDHEFTGYNVIATVEAEENPHLDLVYYEPGYIDTDASNSTTYYYAVTSIDFAGQESELSAESAFDTPRPEGEMVLYDVAIDPTYAAFDFFSRRVVSYEDSAADVYLDRDPTTGVFYINAIYYNPSNPNVLLQAAGYHSSFDGIGWAPQEGWSYTGWAEIVPGHIYIVAIKDSRGWNYAKLRVLAENDNVGTVMFQWAYQIDDNNPELAPPSDANTDLRSREAAGSTL